MEHKIIKKILLSGWLLICILQLAGCGRSGDTEGGQAAQGSQADSDTAYVAKSQEIEAGQMSFVKVIGDTMYYTTGQQKEDTGEIEQTMYRLKNGETNPEKLPVDLEPNVYVCSMLIDAEGNYLFLLDKTGGAQGSGTESYFLSRYKADGAELMNRDITDLGQNEESFELHFMAQDGQGNICLCGSENTPVWILDSEGTQQGKIAGERWTVSTMLTLPGGNAAIYYQDNAGKTLLSEIDTAAKKLGKSYGSLPDSCNYFSRGRENTILMTGKGKLYEYDIQSETASEFLSLLDSGIDSNHVCGISMQDDNGILVALLSFDEGEQKAELACLTQTPDTEGPQKEKIIIGTTYADETLKQNVLSFNKSSDKYQVVLKEYDDGDDTLLNTELIAGDGPDVIDLTGVSDTYIGTYIEKGVLEDLNPFFDKDGEIDRADYTDQGLNLYQKDGKLYCIVPGYVIQTVVAKTSDVGEKPGWTIDDVIALMDSKPEGTQLLRDSTKDTILKYCCTMSQDCFVDMESGVCNFTDGYFEKVLEFADRFPKEAQTEGDDDLHTKIQDGRVLADEITIGDVATYQMMCQLFDSPITCIGLPVKEGNGSYVMSNRIYGINAKSKVKDGAWEFLKLFLMEDYQKYESEMWHIFPVLKSVLDEKFENAMTPEYSEEDGKQVEAPKQRFIYDGWEVSAYAATEEDVEQLKALMENTDKGYVYHREIGNIIKEETAPFFDGQKSAKEVADIIQNRVQTYVNESR